MSTTNDHDHQGPPNSASSTASTEMEPIKIWSHKELESEFLKMVENFNGKESEHNWEAREKSIHRLRGILRGDAFQMWPDTFLVGLKSAMDSIIQTVCIYLGGRDSGQEVHFCAE